MAGNQEVNTDKNRYFLLFVFRWHKIISCFISLVCQHKRTNHINETIMTAMKKILLLIYLMTSSFTLSVAHNLGGHISYRHISGLTYEITVTTATSFTGTAVNADRCTLTLWINSTDSIVLPRVNGTTGSCSTIPISTDGEIFTFNGRQYKKNVYTAQYTFPAPSNYTLMVQDPGRNGSIANAGSGSGQQPLYITASINVVAACPVNSADCDNFSLCFAGVNSTFGYSPAPRNPDGDSLFFELTRPLGDSGHVIPGYIAPSSLGININPITGLLTWPNPPAAGEYLVTVKISQFRSGILMGYITDDITISCQNQGSYTGAFQNASGNWTTDTEGNDVLHILPGEELSFSINYSSNAPSVLSCIPSGMPDSMLYSASPTSSNSYTTSATWTPQASDARVVPYVINLTTENITGDSSMFNLAKSILIFVDGPAMPVCNPAVTLAEKNNGTDFSIFPVPAHDLLQCSFGEEVNYTSISLVNMLGQEILIKQFEHPLKTIDLDISQVPEGIYHIVLKKNKTVVGSKKTVIAG
jgi:hypothetical protein